MYVRPDPLPQEQLVGMIAAECDTAAGIRRGETLGYYCLECGQSDETREQIVHELDCSIAGSHGRQLYGDRLGRVLDSSIGAELHPETSFTIVRWAEARQALGIYKDTVAGFRCDDCANLDETIWHIQHDQLCDHTLEETKEQAHRSRAIADGGDPSA